MLETASVAVSQKASDKQSHAKVKAALSVTNVAMNKWETKISDMTCSLKEKALHECLAQGPEEELA